jgi:hypothetical protein
MSLSCDQTRVAVEKSKLSIAQVNSRTPWVCGDTRIHVSEIDCFVEHDEDPYEIPLIAADDPVSEKIGYNISTMIEEWDCLQMGQGKIPIAILIFLMSKKDLGIHTEVFSDNLIPLIEAGVVNGAKKTINQRKIIATFIQGTKRLYKYIDRNDMICLKPVDYTNDVAVIAQNDNMVAINSAIEVDLMGQVVADSIGVKTFSGVGGQLDFLRGAEQSKNGRPIIALPATAKNGTVSRIVATLAPGTPVTTSRRTSTTWSRNMGSPTCSEPPYASGRNSLSASRRPSSGSSWRGTFSIITGRSANSGALPPARLPNRPAAAAPRPGGRVRRREPAEGRKKPGLRGLGEAWLTEPRTCPAPPCTVPGVSPTPEYRLNAACP